MTESKIYRAGNIVYSKRGLIALVVWLLWADLCFDLMERIPGLIPLKLKALEAPNWMMAVILSTIPMLLNATICPWVSFASDRHRGPLGRRMPFILYTAPFLTLSLIGVGFSAPIATFLHGLLPAAWTLSVTSIELVVVAVLTTAFSFFNMFVASVFWYLFNDVVPREVLSRFLSAMKIVTAGSAAFFNLVIFKHAEEYMPWIFLGGSVLYFVTFVALCLNVKEPSYPPPPENVDGGHGLISGVKTYARECYSHRFYWLYYLYIGFGAVASAINMFNIFFSQEMGLNLEQIGWITGVAGIASVVLFYFAGSLADRFHPLRTSVIAVTVITLVFYPINLLWLFFNPTPQFYFMFTMILSLVQMPFLVLLGVSAQPTEMRIFPQERYGQFCSANAMVRSVLVLLASPLAGVFLDVLKKFYPNGDFAYRFIPAWSLVFGLLALAFLWLLYREWKRLGGDERFTPPEI